MYSYMDILIVWYGSCDQHMIHNDQSGGPYNLMAM